MGGDREYVSIPGNKMHELPPLLVRRLSETPEVDMASAIVEAEEMLPEVDVAEDLLERRKFDLAVTLAEQYRGLILLTHTARSREGFAAGALLAAKWIVGRKGVYEFTEVLDEILASAKETGR